MRKFGIGFLATFLLFISLALSTHDAFAKRMGGGRSMGQQSQNVTRREAAQAPTNAIKPATPMPATPAPAPKRPWGAMLGGLAAGLGLAWLAHSLGMGGAFGNIIMVALLAFLAFAAFNFFMRRKAAQQNGNGQSDFNYAGAERNYDPKNVGNDSAARPFERSTFGTPDSNGGSAIGSAIGSSIGSAINTGNANALSGSQTWGIPADFDTAGFLSAAKTHFINLQAAWDKSDLNSLRHMLSEEMVSEVSAQITERNASSAPGTVHRTEVVSLEAQLLGIEEIAASNQYLASVEFSGMLIEEAGLSPAPFREVWNMSKPKMGGGWLVAGIQALS